MVSNLLFMGSILLVVLIVSLAAAVSSTYNYCTLTLSLELSEG